MTTTHKFDAETLYYIKMTNGDEVLSEIFHVEHSDGKCSYALFRPMAIKIFMHSETHQVSLLASPYVDFLLSDEQIFALEERNILLYTAEISPSAEDMYYKHWGRVDSTTEEIMEDESAEDLKNEMAPDKTDTKKPTVH